MNNKVNVQDLDVERLLNGRMSSSTVETYKTSWLSYVSWLNGRDPLDVHNVNQWKDDMINVDGYSASTINTRLSAIKRVIRELYDLGRVDAEVYVEFDRVRKIPANAMPERRRPNNRNKITPKEMRKIIESIKVNTNDPLLARDRALILVLATSGMRASEAVQVKRQDIVKLEGGYAIDNIIVKGGETRRVPISEECYNAIHDWLFIRPMRSEYVFTLDRWYNPFVPESETVMLCTDKPMDRRNVLYTVKKYARMAGLEHVHTHDFRRFVGTTLAKKDIRTAQKVLGHKSIETTAKYYVMDEVEPGVTEGMF